jgi:dimeric dUTPase (all-alpha-NTP-PPase superfamily)
MASKKGIAVTVLILAVITGASFLFWIVPQDSESTFVVTDYEGYIDGVKNIHEVLQESINIEYQNLQDGEISPSDYSEVADVTTSQVTAQISEFVTSKPPQEWQESYIGYMEALKKFNEYIVETKVAASLIEKESIEEEMTETLLKIEILKDEVKELVKKSDESRPN